MKRIIAFTMVILIVTGVLALSAFSIRNENKPTTSTTYYYVDGYGPNQYIPPGVTGQSDYRDNSLTAYTFQDLSYWDVIPNSAVTGSGNYLSEIMFDEDNYPDGGTDGELTLPEALAALYSYYINRSPHEMPQNGQSIQVGTAYVTFYRTSYKH